MKKIIVLLSVLFFLPLSLKAEDILNILGESLKFDVYKTFIFKIPVAEANFDFNKADGNYKIHYHGFTVGAGRTLKNINKQGSSFLNPTTLLPDRFIHHGTVGDSLKLEEWQFFQSDSIRYSRGKTTLTYQIDKTAYDILSGLNYFRLELLPAWLNKSKNDTVYIPVIKSTEMVMVPVIFLERSTLSFDDKSFEVEIFDVLIYELGKQLFGSDAILRIYIHTGPMHTPLRMDTTVSFFGLNNLKIKGYLNLDESIFPYKFP